MGRKAAVRARLGVERLAGPVRPAHTRAPDSGVALSCLSFPDRWKLIDRLGDDLIEETLNEVAADLNSACDHAVDHLCQQEFVLG